ncbi:hypothetical protein D4764_0143110 [Takifugu flavidus]|uniref:Uncharacterized protein n=1 Tax=Takifugu flavidus TaxID=433684 RepID=A0A5C6MFS7_9TELE|nr:hypothetical protein D4764_0143110 [Takifugu flavidus]
MSHSFWAKLGTSGSTSQHIKENTETFRLESLRSSCWRAYEFLLESLRSSCWRAYGVPAGESTEFLLESLRSSAGEPTEFLLEFLLESLRSSCWRAYGVPGTGGRSQWPELPGTDRTRRF